MEDNSNQYDNIMELLPLKPRKNTRKIKINEINIYIKRHK